MTDIVKTVFTATLVQDSALSVGGIDRQSTADQPLALIDGTPVLSGRGLKGAAVAMARRFFHDLPRSISEDLDREEALVRSAWEFRDAKAEQGFKLGLRAGVGLLHKTGARAQGVLYDREVVEAGARWPLTLCVDWYWVDEAKEKPELVEGILHHVLSKHWKEGRCWLGGGAARGLGWCHLEDLKAYRLDQEAYDRWRRDERLPSTTTEIPAVTPTKNWYFRQKTIELCAGEYKPKRKDGTADSTCWGLDMLAIGPHSQSVQHQPFVDAQHWALPRWATPNPKLETLETIETNRAIAMEGGVPLLPGSSLRGPLRHAASRLRRQAGEDITDPNARNRRDAGQKSGEQATDSPHETSTREDTSAPADSVAQLFGTVETSSRLLICDGHAKADDKNPWLAARMHMHAEDEFSAGSYGSAKREAVRLLRATFSVRLVLEGPDPDAIERDCTALDKLIALGELGHLPLGGHKTHGAGGGCWVDKQKAWDSCSVTAALHDAKPTPQTAPPERQAKRKERTLPKLPPPSATLQHSVQTTPLSLDHAIETLGQAAAVARAELGKAITCWWCEPKIDLDQRKPFDPFGTSWVPLLSPASTLSSVLIDEAIFYSEHASIRFARTRAGMKAVLLRLKEPSTPSDTAARPRAFHAWRHDEQWRFPSLAGKTGTFLFREWRHGDAILGHTATADSEAK